MAGDILEFCWYSPRNLPTATLENTNMPLTNTACKNARSAEKPFKLSDGGGLFLLIQPTGSKLWRMAYRFQKKQKTLAFGAYPDVSLKIARAKRDTAKELLATGIDPSEVKKAEKRASGIAAANTFEVIAREWFNARRAGWTVGYADRLLRRLEADIFPRIGSRPIGEVEPLELLECKRLTTSLRQGSQTGRLPPSQPC